MASRNDSKSTNKDDSKLCEMCRKPKPVSSSKGKKRGFVQDSVNPNNNALWGVELKPDNGSKVDTNPPPRKRQKQTHRRHGHKTRLSDNERIEIEKNSNINDNSNSNINSNSNSNTNTNAKVKSSGIKNDKTDNQNKEKKEKQKDKQGHQENENNINDVQGASNDNKVGVKNDIPDLRPMKNSEKLLCNSYKYLCDNNSVGVGDQGFSILLTTGSLNPIHSGHIDMMDYAKKELEGLNYNVIGGFMSASHDSHVSTKTNYIRSNNRLEMIKLAVKESQPDWIECDEWECKQKDFIDYPQVCKEFSKEINEHLPGLIEEYTEKEKMGENINTEKVMKIDDNRKDNENNANKSKDGKIDDDKKEKKKADVEMKSQKQEIEKGKENKSKDSKSKSKLEIKLPNISLFYVCGRDHADKCYLWEGVKTHDGQLVAKTLVVPRPDAKHKNTSNKNNNENCIVVSMPQEKMFHDRSSTVVRNAILDSKGDREKFNTISNKKLVENILSKNVLEYVEKNLHELYTQLIDKSY